MTDNQAAQDYIEKIKSHLQIIRKLYASKTTEQNREILNKFERVYQYIYSQFISKSMSSNDVFSIYGYFLQTIKRFKRQIENNLKQNLSDYDSFKEKYSSHNIQLVPPLQNQLILDYSQKIDNFDYDKLTNSNFQHHIYTVNELCNLSIGIFDYLKVFDRFKIEKGVMSQLIREISLNYNIIPYHNFTHSFQLFQLLFTCYEKSSLRDFVNEVEIFSALLSGLAHDLNHKGVNNGYKIKKSQKHNQITSEQAVLENMHCATFFNLLHQNKQLDIIESFKDLNQRNQIKKLIITSILATDMSKHQKLVTRFSKRVEATLKNKEIIQKNEDPSELINFLSLNNQNVEDRRFVLNIFVHACDISNPVIEFDLFMNWSRLLSQEFQDQTLKESQNNLDVTVFLKYKDLPTFYNGNVFFAKSLAFPLWKQIGDLFPSLQYLPDQLLKNIIRCEEEKNKSIVK